MTSSAGGWRLAIDAEARVLLPWLGQAGPQDREAMRVWLEGLFRDPTRGREEVPGVFSATVPGTGVVVVWTLDPEPREIVLALIGDA